MFNPSMQVIFRDVHKQPAGKSQELEFYEEDIFIEVVYEKFNLIGNEFNIQNSLINNECDGIYRIFEILECTMWSDMVVNF